MTLKMPKMVPIAIETRGKPFRVQVWRWLTSIRKWELTENWEYPLTDHGPIIVVPKGFVFDGASIPRLFWGLLSPTGLLLIPGLIHDFGYRYDYLWALDSDGCLYKYKKVTGQFEWDALFRTVGKDVNGVAFVDTLAWLALLMFGCWAWRSNQKRNEPDIRPEGYEAG